MAAEAFLVGRGQVAELLRQTAAPVEGCALVVAPGYAGAREHGVLERLVASSTPHLLVQIVDYPSRDIGLEPWHHLVVGLGFAGLLEQAASIPGVVVERISWSRARQRLHTRRALACLRAPGRMPAVLRVRRQARTGLRPIRELTRLYATDPGLHRIADSHVALPSEWLGDDRVLVLFPRFRQEDIVRFALRLDDRLPMGITRHSVPNRALRVYFPTRHLRSPAPLTEKRKALRRFLEAKWEGGSIRSYPESTTLYDE